MNEWIQADPVESGVPHPARVYDFWLGGKDNLAVDRAAGWEVMAAFPEARKMARANRGFLVRAVRYLAGRGVSQFIDLGTGFPTRPNVHEVARLALPDARVLYVDNDPVVAAHNRGLRATTPGVEAIGGDIRWPQQILADPGLLTLIDFSKPVAVLFVAVLHFIRPEADPARIIAAFGDRMAPGSYLAVTHGVSDGIDPRTIAKIAGAYSQATAPVVPRTVAEVAAFFEGFTLAEPGLVDVTRWHPGKPARAQPVRVAAGVGRKAGTAGKSES
ncbi:MAG TPA: SAM-dependent methyltransferase [Streptosporangiaceae bacterium]|nr:SAM-dependent methyltransferase [Streptosporangiaceae bacterium]